MESISLSANVIFEFEGWPIQGSAKDPEDAREKAFLNYQEDNTKYCYFLSKKVVAYLPKNLSIPGLASKQISLAESERGVIGKIVPIQEYPRYILKRDREKLGDIIEKSKGFIIDCGNENWSYTAWDYICDPKTGVWRDMKGALEEFKAKC